MDKIYNIIMSIIIIPIGIILLFYFVGFMSGVSCHLNNNITLEYPCIPVLNNGRTNPNYTNQWFVCHTECLPKVAKINPKTCECTCK
jgi:hypothetical protein